jgi:hypothetical protein
MFQGEKMAKYVRWITFRGREILFMDTPRVTGEAGIAAWEEMEQELQRRPDVRLILVDTTDITLESKTMAKAKEAAAAVKHNPDARIAFVGMSALQKSTAQLIARGLHLQAHFCKTLDEGKEWLIQEDTRQRRGR